MSKKKEIKHRLRVRIVDEYGSTIKLMEYDSCLEVRSVKTAKETLGTKATLITCTVDQNKHWEEGMRKPKPKSKMTKAELARLKNFLSPGPEIEKALKKKIRKSLKLRRAGITPVKPYEENNE